MAGGSSRFSARIELGPGDTSAEAPFLGRRWDNRVGEGVLVPEAIMRFGQDSFRKNRPSSNDFEKSSLDNFLQELAHFPFELCPFA